MKKIIRIMALALVLLTLAGCAGGTKSFTCRDLTMTVPSNMRDVSGQSDFAAYTFTLDSSKLAIFALQERYDEYPVLEEYDLQGYAELVIQANGLDCVPAARSGQDYLYFTYTYQADGTEYKYLTATYQSGEGFWMVQISAPTAQYDEAAYFEYLDSVEFQ